ncbi:MAG TPA: FHA domain-containing protein, partial [Rhizomicrobium sp.]|nr:FHA domain-containing protein [Rhizomicrobium sp.]
MRFILRQITRRAGGGDIVRSRILASAEPVIGRGSDCDIQLPDLAVNLRHAVLRDGGAGRVAVQTLGGAEFEYNGAFFGWAELAVIEMPRLGFGDHVITLEPGEEAGEVLVVVAARESIAAARQEKDGGFSLKSALFSQRRAAWIGLLAILLFCLALPMGQFFTREARIGDRSATRQWSSGPLS